MKKGIFEYISSYIIIQLPKKNYKLNISYLKQIRMLFFDLTTKNDKFN